MKMEDGQPHSRHVLIVTLLEFQLESAHAQRIQNIAKALKLSGWDVTVIAPVLHPDSTLIQWYDGGNFIPIPMAIEQSFLSNPLGRAIIRRFKLVKVVKRTIRHSHSILIIYTSPADVSIPLMIVSRLKKSRVVLEINEFMKFQEFHTKSRLRYAMHWIGVRLLPRFADGVIVIGRELRELLGPVSKSSITIPGLVDPNEFERTLQEAEVMKDKSGMTFKIGYVGSGKEVDGFDGVLQAFSTLRSTDASLVLRLIGSINFGLGRYQQWLTDDLQKNIESLGWLNRQDYILALAGCDCIVLPRPPSFAARNNFPSRLPEVLAAGSVVIVSRVGMLDDYLTDGVDSLLLDVGDSAEISKAIDELRRGKHARDLLVMHGHQVVRRNFDWRVYSPLLSEWLQNLQYHRIIDLIKTSNRDS